MSNQIQIPPAGSPLIDPTTGAVTPPWFYFFLQLFNRVGGASGSAGGGSGGTSPIIPVTAFGGVGDGMTDNSRAFENAFNSGDSVYVPEGQFNISRPIVLTNNQTLIGAGQSSQIFQKNSSQDVVQIQGGYNFMQNLQLNGGNAGVRLFGADGPAVSNSILDVNMWDGQYGLVLDGYVTPNNPCYWNHFYRIDVLRPSVEGVLLYASGGGDSPNANKFHGVRVYSLGSAMTGSGFHLQYARYNNSFIDCEANLYPGATACFRCGPGAYQNHFINPYGESQGPLPGFWLEPGSQYTSIYNQMSASAGAAIYDQSGGSYQSYNSGYPVKNRLTSAVIESGQIVAQSYNVPFINGVSVLNVDGTQSYYLLSAYSGPLTVNLPLAVNAPGLNVKFKRSDASANTITVWENAGSGPGPDANGSVYLNNQYDWLELTSNGATWEINGTNLPPVPNIFVSGVSTYVPDLTKDTYLVSAFSGNVAFELPNAHQPGSGAKVITIKKTDNSANTITITENNYGSNTGSGPDGQTITLGNQYDWIRCYCNGANWWIVAGNIFTKVGVQCTPEFNLDVYSGGYTTVDQGQIARFNAGASPTAGNIYSVSVSKSGTDNLYWGVNKNTATGKVAANALFISSYGASSTMVMGRGNSAGNIDYADLIITGASGAGVVTANGVETCIGVGKGLNFNTTSDQGIAITTANGLKYLLTKILVTNASISLTTAQGGIYTAVSKGGTAVVASTQAYTALSSSAVVLPLTLTTAVNASTITAGELYFSLTTAQGAAATGDVYIFGIPLT